MATIRERVDSTGNKTYHVQVRIKGFPPQTKTFDTKAVAKQWAAQVETELRAGRYMPRVEAQRHTVKELLEDYRDKVLIPNRKNCVVKVRNLIGGSKDSAPIALPTLRLHLSPNVETSY